MNTFSPKYIYFFDPKEGIKVRINEEDLENFKVDLLRIGDLKAPSKPIEVLAVMFDLEGFTTFTRQVDPQLSIPSFISDFFNWLFEKIKEEMIDKKQKGTLWAELPIFSKFMGDGVLFLWKIDIDAIIEFANEFDSDNLQRALQIFICNIIATMGDIVDSYGKFYDSIKRKYVDPPPRLRCGIARGQVFPIGYNQDFVGPCINIANRLQKFNNLSFAFSARGIKIQGFHKSRKNDFVKKRVSIRGIGDNELIFVLKKEFEKLPEEIKKTMTNI